MTVPGDPADGSVFARERQQEIARLVAASGRARVADLVARFGVSAVTIRKDLRALEDERLVVRTHGGAIAPADEGPEPAFRERERLERDAKVAIGAAAAALVGDGESIVLDASSTALYLARSLKARDAWHGLTVVTNSIPIATELADHPGITVLMLGGRVRREALSVVGPLGDGFFERVNVQKAFLGAAGLTLEAGLTDATEEEAHIKRAMVAAAREVHALADHTKWGRVASVTFCRADRLHGIFTDGAAPAGMVEAFRSAGIDVVTVAPGEGARSPESARSSARRDRRG